MTLAQMRQILDQSAALGARPNRMYVNPVTAGRTPRMKQIEALCATRGIVIVRSAKAPINEWVFWEDNA